MDVVDGPLYGVGKSSSSSSFIVHTRKHAQKEKIPYTCVNSPGAAAPGTSCSICSLHTGKWIVQPVRLGRPVVFKEVHLMISSSLKPTFEAVQRRSINIFL